MNRDPIVEEIHRVREQMWDECGGTLEGLLNSLRATEAEHHERIISPAKLQEIQQKSSMLPRP
jgi:hypothetical protein